MDKQVSEKANNPREGNIPLELNNSMKSSETRSTQSNTASEDEAEALLHESSRYDHNRPDRLPNRHSLYPEASAISSYASPGRLDMNEILQEQTPNIIFRHKGKKLLHSHGEESLLHQSETKLEDDFTTRWQQNVGVRAKGLSSENSSGDSSGRMSQQTSTRTQPCTPTRRLRSCARDSGEVVSPQSISNPNRVSSVTSMSIPGALAMPGLRVSELNSYRLADGFQEGHFEFDSAPNSLLRDDIGAPTAITPNDWPVLDAVVAPEEETLGTRRHSYFSGGTNYNHDLEQPNQDPIHEEAEPAIDVKIEPDPVRCFCCVFEGTHPMTRRVPVIYAISVTFVWVLISIVAIIFINYRARNNMSELIATLNMPPPYNETSTSDLSRIDSIAKILTPVVSSPLLFTQVDSVQSQALRWLAHEDSLGLQLDNQKAIIQRFAMRVIFKSMLDETSLYKEEGLVLDDRLHECKWTLMPHNNLVDDLKPLSYPTSINTDSYYVDYYNIVQDHPQNSTFYTEQQSGNRKISPLESQNPHNRVEDYAREEELIIGGVWPKTDPLLNEHFDRRKPQTDVFVQVECNDNQEIIGIAISGVFIASSLPVEFASLSALTSLSIQKASYASSHHSLYKPPSMIPPLTSLNHLTHLSIDIDDFASLDGISDLRYLTSLEVFRGGDQPIPEEVGLIWNLKHLAFHELQLKPNQQMIPDRVLSYLPALESLLVYGCFLGSAKKESVLAPDPAIFELSNYVGTLQNIQNISITNCKGSVQGIFPSNIGKLNKLRHLSLAGIVENSTLPSSLFDMENLTYLDLSANKIQTRLPEKGFAKLSRLETLKLEGNHLFGGIPREISELNSLQYIDLSYNDLTGQIPYFHEQNNLTTLMLHENQLTGNLFEGLCSLEKLNTLSLSGNSFKLFDSECARKLINLQYLYLSETGYSGPFPSEFLTMTELKSLHMSMNNVTGTLPGSIGHLRKLTSLHLDYTSLSGLIPVELGSLQHLSIVSMQGNSLSGPLPMTLCGASNATLLNFGENSLTSLPSCFGEMENLKYLLVNTNKITGVLPSDFGSLRNLIQMDLSENSLSSSIPKEIGQLRALKSLNLSNNSFTGAIPDSLGGLTRLENLDLKNNNLVGSIPVSFVNMSDLVEMDLSGNNLYGILVEFCAERVGQRLGELPGGDQESQNEISSRNYKARQSSPPMDDRPAVKPSDRLGSLRYVVDDNVTCSCCVSEPCLDKNCEYFLGDRLQNSSSLVITDSTSQKSSP